jgi:GWxTD domain-containing protein
MRFDVAHALLRAASRLISTLALSCLMSTLTAQTPSFSSLNIDVAYIIRIADANQKFTSNIPGWKTDRGRIYIKYGLPDEINSHPAASYQRPLEQGGGATSTYPFEQWCYRYLEGIGADVVFEFVDHTTSGEYRLIVDPTDKDAVANLRGNLNPIESRHRPL